MLRTAAAAFVPAFGVLALAATTTFAQPDRIDRQTLQSEPAPTPAYRTELVRVKVAKGALVARHTHPGLEIGYVEEGLAEVKIAGQADRRLGRGQSFAVPRSTPHSVQNVGPGELTILSTYVVDASKPLATPDP